jgi:7,8-dihydropterin-6-yl-methyl-4-(beta-D-ribofuranosyl)aminobenzene 5'-phosphate synthase
MSSEAQATATSLRITVVYNNVPYAPELTTAWGFAAVIEAGADTLLFDTGGDGPTLLGNFERLGIDPRSIDTVVLSHIHGDHTGGLHDFLGVQPGVTVYMPDSFPVAFRRPLEQRGARVVTVGNGPQHLFAHAYSTGELGDGTYEQALILDTQPGLVVVTGCAHPGIADIARAASAFRDKPVYMLIGGFHLGGQSTRQLRTTLQTLRDAGARKVAPSHCTGDAAIALFREQWGSDFVEGGLGAVIEIA